MKQKTVYGKRVSPLLIQYTDLLKKQKTALEIGCAYGASSTYLASLGIYVDAIDRELPLGIQETERVSFRELDIRDFDFAKKYDIVFAFNSLQFLPMDDKIAIMDKMYSCLFQHGLLIIKSFTVADPSVGKKGLSHFDHDELLKWAQKKNLEIIEYREYVQKDEHAPCGPHEHGMVELVARKK